MLKKNTYLLLLIFLFNSCGSNTFDSFKRGVTGEKQKSSDEFLVEKKDPLVLPPDFERLPEPEDSLLAEEKISNFEKTLKKNLPEEDISSSAGSAEQSILKKIKRK
jgi:hypothetical protein